MDDTLKQQQQGSTTSEPVTVERMVELFESLKDHPHENGTTTAILYCLKKARILAKHFWIQNLIYPLEIS